MKSQCACLPAPPQRRAHQPGRSEPQADCGWLSLATGLTSAPAPSSSLGVQRGGLTVPVLLLVVMSSPALILRLSVQLPGVAALA